MMNGFELPVTGEELRNLLEERSTIPRGELNLDSRHLVRQNARV
jgi:hypothetical protein